jgi:hypothetical protein
MLRTKNRHAPKLRGWSKRHLAGASLGGMEPGQSVRAVRWGKDLFFLLLASSSLVQALVLP